MVVANRQARYAQASERAPRYHPSASSAWRPVDGAIPGARLGRPAGHRNPGQRARRPNPLIVLPAAVIVVVSMTLGFVAQRTQVMALSYQVRDLKLVLSRLAQEHQYLQLELARARSLERVEAAARQRLNMVSPDRTAVIVVPARPQRAAEAPVASTATSRAGWLAALVDWAHRLRPATGVEAGRHAGSGGGPGGASP